MVCARDPRPQVHLSVLTSSVRSVTGTLIVLFFKCMTALFNPVYRRGEAVKWGLVSFTVVMFSLATVHTAMDLNLLSTSYIDNRDFPGVEGVSYPGPYGYMESIYFKAINIISNATFPLNNWLADGLLVSHSFYSVFTRSDV